MGEDLGFHKATVLVGMTLYTYIAFLTLFISYNVYISIRINLVFGARQFLLAAPAYLAMANKAYDVDAIFTLHMKESQTIGAVIYMFILGNLALLFSHLGYIIGAKTRINYLPKRQGRHSLHPAGEGSIVTFGLCLLATVPISYFVSLTTLAITTAAYASDESRGSVVLPVQVHFVITTVLLNLALVNMLLIKRKLWLVPLAFAITTTYAVGYVWTLRGFRMEVMHAVLSLGVTYALVRGVHLRLTVPRFVVGLAVFLLGQVLATLRSTLAGNFSRDDVIAGLRFVDLKVGDVPFYQGTLNDLAANVTGIFSMLDAGMVKLQWGWTYFEYILRTPPEFLFPSRPDGNEWLFTKAGWTNGGGFSELAEAYYNFGFVGCILVPPLISFFLGWILTNAQRAKTMFSYVLLISLMSNFLRWNLYTTFALWKSMITGVLLWSVVKLFERMFVQKVLYGGNVAIDPRLQQRSRIVRPTIARK